jgi:RHS repeat-associated protein
VNRLVTGETTSTYSTSPTNCWGEAYVYDNQPAGGEFGNLTNINAASTAYNGCTQESLGVTASAQNQITTFSYDASGDVLSDTHNTYAWNAEAEIKTGAGINYTYDGDGDRVQKSNGKIYWYGAGNQVLDESSASGSITDEYVFFSGKRIAHRVVSGNAITYYGEDMLGTSRVIMTSAGSLCYDADFYPFGGERAVTSTCAQNYKFEGKERDAETTNDDFGARYYSSAFGRWTSPDWSSTPAPVPYANLTNPQTLNMYAMVHDNPETFADLDGHDDDGGGDGGGDSGGSGTGTGSGAADQQNQTKNQPAQNGGTAQNLTPQPSQGAQNQMSLSSKGLDFIKKYEKLRLNPYKDQAGYETIGYGHKILPGEDFSNGITKAQALDLLNHDAQGAVSAVNASLNVPVKQNQFDALVSLAFNAGPVSVKATNQMMRAVNAGNVTEENFTAYRFVHVNGQAVVSQGLLRRREDEYLMYSEGEY